MSTTALAEPPTLANTGEQRAYLLAMALTSFGALLLELSLVRLFSVVLFYHFAFLAISLALLGLGAGGVFAYLFRRRLQHIELRRLSAALCISAALSVVLALVVVLHSSIPLYLSWIIFFRLALLYLVAAVPFFHVGVVFSVVFARATSRISQLYAFDLLGGALACLAVVPALNLAGGPNAVLLAGAAFAIAAVIWSPGGTQRNLAFGLAAVFFLLIAANWSGHIFDIVYAKGVRRDQPWVLFSKWNAISRVEVNDQGGSKVIVIDADASTHIMGADPHQPLAGEWRRSLMSAPPSVANILRPNGHFAIIGPGGGVDVLRAVASGSPRVTAIEINPIIATTIMREQFADYSHRLYLIPEVEVHVADGRSFIRSSRDRYDVVQMTLVDTWASTAAGAFALSENNLYTTNAFREYFEHLKDSGFIAITRWEFRRPREALRVVSQAMAALNQLGIADTRGHFIVVSEGELNEDGIPVLVLAKKTPFTPEEEGRVREHLAAHPKLALLHSPSQPRDNAFTALIHSNDAPRFTAQYPYNVAPVSDDDPFFFFTLKTGQAIKDTLAARGTGIDWKNNFGLMVLGILLLLSVLAVLAFLVLPLLIGTRAERAHVRPLPLLYFVAVGLGYIVVEIAFIQRFVLFLGHPTYALTVVVFLMLLSSGIGSYLARRWFPDPRRIWTAAVITTAAALAYLFILPPLLSSLVGLPFAAKLLLSAAVLAPLGFVMGMPFPTGIRALAGAGQQTVEWAWAMNAASSVLGSVAAMVIAIHWGLNVTLLVGAAAYLAAALLVRSFRPLASNV